MTNHVITAGASHSLPSLDREGRGLARLALLVPALFVGPWAFWFSRIAEGRGLIGWHLPQGAALWSMTPLMLLAVGATGGRAGLLDLARRIGRWRVPRWTYLVALTTPLAIGLVSLVGVRLLGGSVAVGQSLSLGSAAGYLVYGTGLFLLTEEAGWRGVLLPRLQGVLGPMRTAAVVGVLWAVWHLPLLAVPGESDQGLPVLPFCVLILATSVMVSALVNAAGGSVLVAAVFHASFDACYSFLGVVGSDHAMLWGATAVSVLTAAVLITATRGRLCLDRQPSSPTQGL